jgi:hypothetical protein
VRRALFAAGAALLVASCSDGDHSLSKAEYAQRADQVCARYNQATRALGTPGTSLQSLARYANASLPILDRAVARLRRLKPPKDEQALAQRWLSSLGKLRADVVKIRDTAQANDIARVRALALSAKRDDAVTNRLARRLGTRVCSAG